jgi:hypothetical protein
MQQKSHQSAEKGINSDHENEEIGTTLPKFGKKKLQETNTLENMPNFRSTIFTE